MLRDGEAFIFADLEPPKCDICGESEVTIQFAEVGTCDAHGEQLLSCHLAKVLGYSPCATIVWFGSRPALCLVKSGTEHDHNE